MDANPSYLRMFIGIKPDETTRLRLIEWGSAYAYLPEIRWVLPQNLHLSALFLGNVPEEQLDNLNELFRHGLSGEKAFQLSFDAIVSAPSGQKARMLWARYRKSSEFRSLVQKLQFFYEQIQSKQQNRLSPIPHITLARFNEPDHINSIQLPQRTTMPDFVVHELVLWSSRLSPEGPDYTEIQKFSLSS